MSSYVDLHLNRLIGNDTPSFKYINTTDDTFHNTYNPLSEYFWNLISNQFNLFKEKYPSANTGVLALNAYETSLEVFAQELIDTKEHCTNHNEFNAFQFVRSLIKIDDNGSTRDKLINRACMYLDIINLFTLSHWKNQQFKQLLLNHISTYEKVVNHFLDRSDVCSCEYCENHIDAAAMFLIIHILRYKNVLDIEYTQSICCPMISIWVEYEKYWWNVDELETAKMLRKDTFWFKLKYRAKKIFG